VHTGNRPLDGRPVGRYAARTVTDAGSHHRDIRGAFACICRCR